MEQFEKPGNERSGELEDIKFEERRIRDLLEEALPDDKQFQEITTGLANDMVKLSSLREGLEKARILASANALQKKLQATQRYKLSARFVELSNKREKLELAEAELSRNNRKGRMLKFPSAS